MDKDRVERIFSMFMYLTFNKDKSVEDLAKMLGVSRCTIYRYIELYKNLGFELSTKYGNVYRIVSYPKEFKELSNIPLGGTAPCWIADTNAVESWNGSTYEVLEDFRENSAYTKVPYLIKFTHNANKLIKASKEKKIVILRQYGCDESNGYCDRKVEPYNFGWYFNYLWAYDHKTMKNEMFRVTQIDEVVILDQDWSEEKRHKKQKLDVFGTAGHTTINVKVMMTLRVKNRLLDEHPMAIRKVKRLGDTSMWLLDTEVCGYRELTRFCQGFMDEVEILEGEGLMEYMIRFIDEQLKLAKENLALSKMKDRAKMAIPTLPEEDSERQVERRRLEGRKKFTGVRQTA